MASKLDPSSSVQDLHRDADDSKGRSDRADDLAQSMTPTDGKEALVLPKQAMAAALGTRRASEADTETGDVPMPWWYTPRRLLVIKLTLPYEV